MTAATDTVRLDCALLQERLASANPPRLLDVRTPAEFAAVHIPGSYNVPLDTLREHRDELRHHLDTDVVLVCRSGQRAEQAERTLAEAGLPGVQVLTGGMSGWEAVGGTVNRGRDCWDLERQVRFTAGSLVLGGVLGSIAVPRLKWLSGAIGAGLVFAGATGTCGMAMLLAKMPWNRPSSYDPQAVIGQLAESR
ncbi:rhodanese-like domain-containing protein [Pseudonocardia asaccharolytica]|uniref:Sulfurtransferase n=1 Tax=Pseudonocardia asaccharolytica DSM 44247 = NBRC 16224 TaxID=1123024 RepID=A0A511CWZ2_9PSEU|nr:rhodanese-like domain-containing protein [Pseudonocardia asaccharolytica]GEL17081.1 sulfurtransferase [Pseudonocardia asaccharolytica DSM 44247 = NBRC 16224]